MIQRRPDARRSDRTSTEIVISSTVASKTEAFVCATSELAALLPEPRSCAVLQRLPVLVAPAPPSQLLLDFVRELLTLAETEAFFARRVERITLSEGVRAAVSGEIGGGPPVTLACGHASLLETDDGWRMRIVLLRPPASSGAHDTGCSAPVS